MYNVLKQSKCNAVHDVTDQNVTTEKFVTRVHNPNPTDANTKGFFIVQTAGEDRDMKVLLTMERMLQRQSRHWFIVASPEVVKKWKYWMTKQVLCTIRPFLEYLFYHVTQNMVHIETVEDFAKRTSFDIGDQYLYVDEAQLYRYRSKHNEKYGEGSDSEEDDIDCIFDKDRTPFSIMCRRFKPQLWYQSQFMSMIIMAGFFPFMNQVTEMASVRYMLTKRDTIHDIASMIQEIEGYVDILRRQRSNLKPLFRKIYRSGKRTTKPAKLDHTKFPRVGTIDGSSDPRAIRKIRDWWLCMFQMEKVLDESSNYRMLDIVMEPDTAEKWENLLDKDQSISNQHNILNGKEKLTGLLNIIEYYRQKYDSRHIVVHTRFLEFGKYRILKFLNTKGVDLSNISIICKSELGDWTVPHNTGLLILFEPVWHYLEFDYLKSLCFKQNDNPEHDIETKIYCLRVESPKKKSLEDSIHCWRLFYKRQNELINKFRYNFTSDEVMQMRFLYSEARNIDYLLILEDSISVKNC